MDDAKVKTYSEEVIQDTAFPQEQQIIGPITAQANPTGVFSENKIEEQIFPTERIAVDVISNVLNTKSKKILGEFAFTPSGALQIGEYEPGVSGDVRLSPNGIVARDIAGNQTFLLDGDTGDAVFAGTVQTGAIVAGQMIVGDDAIQIDGINKRMLFYDGNGIPSIVIGTVA